ncbi:SGNH/GDSL hydrolase family protein [Nonomuraea aridisoli]|uniref:SGNH/GDSL hydrolase family protein n=1 Tax=Nonomuraea aridisoli TaxID=2070368 RepID=A0A2W2F423_9ACTN|nr:SGNH/GDSL hydrolase family protein [Nonomuraea aridisoli]PZG20490.1 SGNH/GDSL hydrolase family protein [Nonomuraea aridisoli]
MDVITRAEPVTWLFAGDSIVQGARWTDGARGYAELFTERVRYELGRRMDAVINTGVSGWRATDLAEHLERAVLHHRPDVVLVGVGVNDSQAGAGGLTAFAEVLSGIVSRVRQAGALVVLQTPVPVLPEAPPERVKWFAPYAQSVRDVAAGQETVLVDHAAHWAAHADRSWYGDPTHPNAAGHREMARTLLKIVEGAQPE